MELFAVMPGSGFEGDLGELHNLLVQRAAEDLHTIREAGGTRIIRFELSPDKRRIDCRAVLPEFKLLEHGAAVYRTAAQALAEYFVTYLESAVLNRLIQRKYRNWDNEAAVLAKYCQDLLYGTETDGLGVKFRDADAKRRKAKVADEIELYLREHTLVNLTGLIDFRLQAYRSELNEIVEYAMDEYVLDKQYQEFISLLKYFVCLQETKVPEIHLVHKGGHEFEMYNERFQRFEAKPHTDRVVAEMLETEINIEDMVISSLISVSPKMITIHTRQPEAQVIRTIESIFDRRVQLCVKCASCAKRLDEMDNAQS
ncbi:putative sporulation protein YtxC [Paenibacillus thailandensis]|uniref:Sporulation protein YtxC n=1 Tax=Paenibacillus thailandensis TaxID=393250 RepID=A0ABW5QS03_9BACL